MTQTVAIATLVALVGAVGYVLGKALRRTHLKKGLKAV